MFGCELNAGYVCSNNGPDPHKGRTGSSTVADAGWGESCVEDVGEDTCVVSMGIRGMACGDGANTYGVRKYASNLVRAHGNSSLWFGLLLLLTDEQRLRSPIDKGGNQLNVSPYAMGGLHGSPESVGVFGALCAVGLCIIFVVDRVGLAGLYTGGIMRRDIAAVDMTLVFGVA